MGVVVPRGRCEIRMARLARKTDRKTAERRHGLRVSAAFKSPEVDIIACPGLAR